MNAHSLGDIIRTPFLWIGDIIKFIINNIVSILIVVGSLWLVYWLFSSGTINKLSSLIKEIKDSKNNQKANNNNLNIEGGIVDTSQKIGNTN